MLRLKTLFDFVVRMVISWCFLGLVSLAFVPIFLILLPSRRLRILASNVYGKLIGRVMAVFARATLPAGVEGDMRAAQPAIYVANHASYLDIYLGVWSAPFGTLATAKKETVFVPFFGQLYALSGNVLIDRANRRDAASALRETIDLLKRYRTSVWIWPEGTRSADGRLLPFKRGFAHVALATRLPVVPVVLTGTHRCWPKGRIVTHASSIRLRVLDPIPTTSWSAETIDHHVAEVHARFAAALPDDQQPCPRT
jgi:1-acyl-sn-glycerol-3-phosphate acyltransferase